MAVNVTCRLWVKDASLDHVALDDDKVAVKVASRVTEGEDSSSVSVTDAVVDRVGVREVVLLGSAGLKDSHGVTLEVREADRAVLSEPVTEPIDPETDMDSDPASGDTDTDIEALRAAEGVVEAQEVEFEIVFGVAVPDIDTDDSREWVVDLVPLLEERLSREEADCDGPS